ncbi:MAG: carboxypeptidase-like regulatory domain-containing protein [Spirochaetaceae bacterium]
MNKARIRGTAIAVLLIATALLLGGCGLVGGLNIQFFDIDGNIVDSRSEDLEGVEDVTVTLTAQQSDDSDETDDEFEVTTDSLGNFSVAGIPSGTYFLTATKDGWFIPSQTVSIGQSSEGINDIPAFQLRAEDLYGISFILMWNDQVDDVDIHLTFPTTWNAIGQPTEFDTPYDSYQATTGRSQVFYRNLTFNDDQVDKDGFDPIDTDYPSDDPDEDPYYEDNDLFPRGLAYMDRDDRDGLGPETATLVEVTYDYPYGEGEALEIPGDYSMEASEKSNGIATAFSDLLPSDTSTIDFGWIGTAEVYIDTYDDPNSSADDDNNLSSGATDSAEAIVYVVQTLPAEDLSEEEVSRINDDPKSVTSEEEAAEKLQARYLGAYRIPEATTIKSARIIRVNMLESYDDSKPEGEQFGLWYQLVPNIQVIPEGPNVTPDNYDEDITFQSADDSGIFGAYGGPSRR